MAKVKLNPTQKRLQEEIRDRLQVIKQKFETYPSSDDDNLGELIEQLGALAHNLHVSLKPAPKHHRYMIKNRGINPGHPDFYKHVHPVEDLLAYLANDKANDDPEDQTLNSHFHMDVYTRRWGHSDRYQLTRVIGGWHFKFLGKNITSKKNGRPGLFKMLDHDSVNYPEALPDYMQYLWDKADTDGLTPEEVQKNLDELSKWISDCEKKSPKGIFRGLK